MEAPVASSGSFGRLHATIGGGPMHCAQVEDVETDDASVRAYDGTQRRGTILVRGILVTIGLLLSGCAASTTATTPHAPSRPPPPCPSRGLTRRRPVAPPVARQRPAAHSGRWAVGGTTAAVSSLAAARHPQVRPLWWLRWERATRGTRASVDPAALPGRRDP